LLAAAALTVTILDGTRLFASVSFSPRLLAQNHMVAEQRFWI
jgi:hypothetical protein